MKAIRLLSIICFIFVSCFSHAQNQIPDPSWQIKTAVLALPASNQEGATVLGYNSNGELTVLREGTNQFICLADDPKKDGFSVAGYHKGLEPYMARGRALRKEGKDAGEIFDIRENEVKSGKLTIPDKSILYVASGDVDASGTVSNIKVRYVVYIPYETAESTGLSPAPLGPGAPWIMNPGTHRAHIMITPE